MLYEVIDLWSTNTIFWKKKEKEKGAILIVIQETVNYWVSSSLHLVHWLS